MVRSIAPQLLEPPVATATGTIVFIRHFQELIQHPIFNFRVGAEDAERLEKELGTFVEDDFCYLPKYHVYLRLMIDGIAGDAFLAITLPPEDLFDTEMNTDKIIRVSRERFATKQSIVEEKINKCIASQF